MPTLAAGAMRRAERLTVNAVDLRMPEGCSAQTGILHRFVVGDGRRVREGDLVAEVEIDKTIIDVTSPVHGSVCCVAPHAEGAELPVGAMIACIMS